MKIVITVFITGIALVLAVYAIVATIKEMWREL